MSGMTRGLKSALHVLLVVLVVVFSGEAWSDEASARLGLPPVPDLSDDAQTPQSVALGRKLFFDSRLSADGSVSCAFCHRPDQAFTDGRKVAVGVENRTGTRNTPTLLNAAHNSSFFWEGRRVSLEEQVLDPLLNRNEHGLADLAVLVALVKADATYRQDFKAAFPAEGGRVGAGLIAKALATFVRSLIAGGSPFDRYFYGGDRAALGDAAVRGLALFRGRAQCGTCHMIAEHAATFSDGSFHRVGVGLADIAPDLGALVKRVIRMPEKAVETVVTADPGIAALGRFLVTRDPADIGKFRTPSLRNVAVTAPYMHDGSIATLEEALDWELYRRNRSTDRPVVLTISEREELLAFLRSLTSESLQ